MRFNMITFGNLIKYCKKHDIDIHQSGYTTVEGCRWDFTIYGEEEFGRISDLCKSGQDGRLTFMGKELVPMYSPHETYIVGGETYYVDWKN